MTTNLKTSIALCALIVSGLLAHAQDIAGSWNGALHLQPKDIPIVFHISKDSTGQFIASFDSPTQNAFNLPVSAVITKQDSVILMIAMLNGKYAGVLGQDKKTIDGTWFQGKASFPLTVTKTSDVATVKRSRRPQTPTPPFPYEVRDVEYDDADKTIHYGATLTAPPNPDKKTFPAIVLITGSGQQDRDETLFDHKPFAVIADNLTKHGFVVLRVDDEGIGKTTGDFSQATSLDFAKDVEASLDFLETQPEVDKQNIGLLGHSEGGMIAPMVANERKEVRFIVLLAGPGIPIIDLMEQQQQAVGVSMGQTPAEAKAGSDLMRVVYEESIKGQDTATTFKNIRARVDAWGKTQDTATWAKIQRKSDALDDQIRQAMVVMTTKWFHYFINYDPQPALRNLHCKVLALGGSKDVQVIASTNLAGIKASLQKSHSPKYDVIELPGLNHLFQTCTRCSPAEYGDLEETFSPGALTVMDNWLAKNVQ